ncbi:MAG: methylmalonyl Co-A mutase-associated GTPase MeaB [Rhodothermales bacterium]|nr:methylmalonyl Co-A mutase-associated GTPase MeaB [Rhodothermales bacterium]
MVQDIRSGDRSALARAITLVESKAERHRLLAEKVLDQCARTGRESVRVGFSGVPGAGKSTLIEKLGMRLIGDGHRVAVLAVDPSSTRSGGSILGDKTRMEDLSRETNAFIRPSPSQGSLGGVATRTREAISLCEAAGYDIVLIETVGVGQSEAEVAHLADFVFLLAVTGAGDELQGIKRGVIEYADAVLVTKADGDNESAARIAVQTYEAALQLFRDRDSGWSPRILAVSALEDRGLNTLWSIVSDYRAATKTSGYWDENRSNQSVYWLHASLITEIQESISASAEIREGLARLEDRVRNGLISPRSAAAAILKSFLKLDHS